MKLWPYLSIFSIFYSNNYGDIKYTINVDINGNYSEILVILISVSHNIVLVWCYDIILMW